MGTFLRKALRSEYGRVLMRTTGAVLLLLPLFSTSQAGTPWFEPGQTLARHAFQVLADAGAIEGPIMTWPLPTPALHRELSNLEPGDFIDEVGPMTGLARYLLEGSRKRGVVIREVSAVGTLEPMADRNFTHQHRTNSQTALALDWMSPSVAARVRGVWDVLGENSVRPDGSYLASYLGDWIFSTGYVDRFWGPGWSTSLGWSMQSAPPLSVWAQRRFQQASGLPLLKWLGPWNILALVSQTDAADRRFDTSIVGTRLSFRPVRSLSLGLSYLQRVCWTACSDALVGQSEQPAAQEQASGFVLPTEPGRQLLVEGRVRPFKSLTMAGYAQGSASSPQSGSFGTLAWMAGVEVWSVLPLSWLSSVRVYAEYVDGRLNPLSENRDGASTWTDFSDYNKGEVLLEGADARAVAAGVLLMFARSHVVHLQMKHLKRNRFVERLLDTASSHTARAVFDARYEYRWSKYVLSLAGGMVHDAALNPGQFEAGGLRGALRLARIY